VVTVDVRWKIRIRHVTVWTLEHRAGQPTGAVAPVHLIDEPQPEVRRDHFCRIEHDPTVGQWREP
jgi:hypothetical protein